MPENNPCNNCGEAGLGCDKFGCWRATPTPRKAAAPFRVTPDQGAEMGRIATAELFRRPTSREDADGR